MDALFGLTLLHHKRRTDDGMSSLEKADDRSQKKQPCGIGDEDNSRRGQEIPNVRNKKDTPPAEEIRENSGRDDRETVKGPVDSRELGNEKHVETDREKVEVEEETNQTNREAAERSTDQKQASVSAKAPEPLTHESTAPGLANKDKDDYSQDTKADCPHPERCGDLGRRAVLMATISPSEGSK